MSAREDAGIRPLLDQHRSRAERLLNDMRAMILLLLGTAAAFYASSLPAAVNRVNLLVLVPILGWTIAQWAVFHRRDRLPRWLTVANPLIDVTWITLLVGAYGLVDTAQLGLRSPMFLAYFAVLAARPITSSTRLTAVTATLCVVEYAALSVMLIVVGGVQLAATPVVAAASGGISLLDECAKLLLLAVAGGVAVYATAWQERLLLSYHAQMRDREQLQTELARAQLRSLELQLHPHFLFNTLNTITALLHTDARRAERVVASLSELLRFSLRGAAEQVVALERELEVLRRYVEIQQMRFSDRLTVELVVDPRAARALVPSFLLQPLVENSIHHGIAPRASGGTVRVVVERLADDVRITVTDDGVGAAVVAGPSRLLGEGVGLGNTRARLRHLYGDRHRFDAGARGAGVGGFEVLIVIPFRDSGVPTPPAVLEGVA
ncbi:MAG TPA: histidine kinase [Gemmatimonadaceae bacterium]|jgi:two-component sensor histidine kinase